MTLEFITTDGVSLDLTPNQEIEITFEQPFLSSDKMPVAGSTSIEFPLTPNNKKVFGYWAVPFMGVEHREIAVSIYLAGVPVWTGKLTEPEVVAEAVSWTFIGASLDPILEQKIYDLPGLQIESTEPLLLDARTNEREDIGFPMMMRQTYAADCEYQKGAGTYTTSANNSTTSNADCSPSEKYVNWGFVAPDHAATPVVKVLWLLNKILPGVEIDNNILWLLARCAIWAPHARTYKRIDGSGLYDTMVYCLNVADGLPDISIADFLSNILKMFCASLYYTGTQCRIIANKSILSSRSFVDWSNKITLPLNFRYSSGQNYKLAYANEDASIDAIDEEEAEVMCVSNVDDMLLKLREWQELKSIKYSSSSNLYSGRCFRINPVFTTSLNGVYPQWQWEATPQMDLVVMECVRYTDINDKTIKIESAEDEFDASIAFKCVKCVPVKIYQKREYPSEIGEGILAIVPVLNMPTVDTNRTSEVYIGLLENNQWVSNGGIYIEQNWTEHTTPDDEVAGYFSDDDVGNITFSGEDGLWEKYHKNFAEWLARPRHSFTTEVLLSLSDLIELDLSKPVFAYNKNFFIQELRVRLNTSWGLVKCEADLIEK